MDGDITMKNKLLTAFTIAAISCSSMISLANESKYNGSTNYNESSLIENIASDIAITLSIKKAYAMDDHINSFNIRVKTVNGKVTLNGTVPDEKIKDLVISIAKNTKGVAEVSANLKVTSKNLIQQASSDSIITTKIKLTYFDDPNIKLSTINVITINGKVTLNGKTQNEQTRKKAINIAKETKGVKEVITKIEIDKSIISSSLDSLALDSAITSMIKLGFFEDDILSSLDLHVKTINGEVILSGNVLDKTSKERAISIANSTRGVNKVISNIVVQH